MTENDFNSQMERLKHTWPHPNNWSSERVKLIWVAVHQRSAYWFEKLITGMIATSRQCPVPQDFIEAERVESRRSVVYTMPDHLKPMANSIFTEQERQEFFKVMKDAVAGKISRKEAQAYAEMIYAALKQSGVKLDYHFEEGEIIYHDFPIQYPQVRTQ